MGLRECGTGDEHEDAAKEKKKTFKEFECPICNAFNPYDDGFKADDEVRCCYCGCGFTVIVSEMGAMKLKEI